ncbi:hypothetical protein POPTR_007G062061v4 [Populus trichocarpa]|uniref:Uncharacterized protein n=1 Tax=Populus trichocarpa TaxID=3694 RepID=A0ACC0SPV5_POPTR|nr:hypothetical protein POPTR_007G062061v4 [Populus trichocarpa]
MGDHWSDALGETNSQGVTGGVYRARHVCGPAHKGHADLTSSPPSSSISLAVPHLPPPSYRGCWHGVSRGFFLESCHDRALDERALQAALPFFTHAILLDRAFAHCPRFPTAAPRGSPGRVSVPVWLIIRKDQLSIIGLLSSGFGLNCSADSHALRTRSPLCSQLFPPPGRDKLPLARSLFFLLPENNVRLACVKHIASLPSEPGSNSSFEHDHALQW